MYHYVRPFDSRMPFLKRLDILDFKKQLDYFENEFGFVKKNDFVKSLETGQPTGGVVLTFDDGLKCHYRYVYPELLRRNLWGIFYVPTLPYVEYKLIDVHRVHLLLGTCDGKTVYDLLMEFVKPEHLIDKEKSGFREKTYVDQSNDEWSLLVKRILNYYIDYNVREEIIDRLIEVLIPDVNARTETYYVNTAEMKEMQANEMLIGSHTVSHPVLSKLSINEQRTEIADSFKFLETELGIIKPKTFCYPYGGETAFTKETEKILADQNCNFSFNVEPRDITKDDLLSRPQALPRFDCNQFPYGQCQ